ncbi:MAG: alpha-L-fucosidase [Prolixibacteraceae bacterium]|nr:alpha-L-fucosidase [Prolixibacteraceae bacterium]
MKFRNLLFGLFFFCSFATNAQKPDLNKYDVVKTTAKSNLVPTVEELRTTKEQADSRLGWWRDARFGMFVHWGVYSNLSGSWKGKDYGGYGEHIQRMAQIPIREYIDKVAGSFNPIEFNADEWIRLAKQAGMRYFIITAKHHDGFAMFDSKVSDHTIIKATPFSRDPMKDLAAACKKYGIKYGFYYSHAFDWGEENAPGNDWDFNNPGGDKLLSGFNWWEKDTAFLLKVRKYVDEKSIPQIQELIKNYDPDIMWFDTPHKLPMEENCRIYAAVRKAKPDIVVNGRLIYGLGDYQNTCDCPLEFHATEGDWEGIPTTNNSYGYNKNDHSHKPAGHFVMLLAKAVARGGNLLMNIGPMGTGAIDINDVKILEEIGHWFEVNGESIHGCGRTPLQVQPWGETTLKGNTLYLHVFDWPKNGQLTLGGVYGDVKKAYLLSDRDKKLKVQYDGTDLDIEVPTVSSDTIDAVVAVEFKTVPKGDAFRLISANVSSNVLRTLDANVSGGVQWGDGNRKQNFAWKWKTKDGTVSWDIRITKKSSFNLFVNYEAPGELKAKMVEGYAGKELQNELNGSGGTFIVSLGNQFFTKEVTIGGKQNELLGKVVLEPGTYQIKVSAKEIRGEELFRLNSLVLKPL